MDLNFNTGDIIAGVYIGALILLSMALLGGIVYFIWHLIQHKYRINVHRNGEERTYLARKRDLKHSERILILFNFKWAKKHTPFPKDTYWRRKGNKQICHMKVVNGELVPMIVDEEAGVIKAIEEQDKMLHALMQEEIIERTAEVKKFWEKYGHQVSAVAISVMFVLSLIIVYQLATDAMVNAANTCGAAMAQARNVIP